MNTLPGYQAGTNEGLDRAPSGISEPLVTGGREAAAFYVLDVSRAAKFAQSFLQAAQ